MKTAEIQFNELGQPRQLWLRGIRADSILPLKFSRPWSDRLVVFAEAVTDPREHGAVSGFVKQFKKPRANA